MLYITYWDSVFGYIWREVGLVVVRVHYGVILKKDSFGYFWTYFKRRIASQQNCLLLVYKQVLK